MQAKNAIARDCSRSTFRSLFEVLLPDFNWLRKMLGELPPSLFVVDPIDQLVVHVPPE